ncbi:hypothetical protein [Pedobacter zeae]|uniref:Uncharacterized protein n=1 Tax=Pedobacter zeae TaxID=1737356 RepID=A0A7W6K7F8_9SPHI|nr:hypothetical protein [Pedobacter zeae]MBB4106618.1 hypothetical protein [Pedobacter zeae]GGH02749.1 hypothetical protein GCM10007422_17380 [Pedobacter zeae]
MGSDLIDNGIEGLAVETLLERGLPLGVKAPFFLRWLGFRLNLYQPSLGNKIRIARLYLKMNIPDRILDQATLQEADDVLVKHAFTIAKIVAIGCLKGYLWPLLFSGILARWLMWNRTPQQLQGYADLLILYSGTGAFMNTTRCIRNARISAPTLGQNPKRS